MLDPESDTKAYIYLFNTDLHLELEKRVPTNLYLGAEKNILLDRRKRIGILDGKMTKN